MRDKTKESATGSAGSADAAGPGGRTAGPGEKLVRAGAIVFFIGVLCTTVTVAPLFLGTAPFPTFMFGLSMLMGVGFLIAASGLLLSISAQRRAVREAQTR